MTGDPHADPYRPQHRPFVLPCAECGAVERVRGLRAAGHTVNTPYDPLCGDCTAIWRRVWGEGAISTMSPPDEESWLTEDTTPDGGKKTVRLWVTLCPRCDGDGVVGGYRGTCFACYGARWVPQEDGGVQRTARWWSTYHQNRIP